MQKISSLSKEKLKTVIFDSLLIGELVKASHFQDLMNNAKTDAQFLLTLVIKSFLVERMLSFFNQLTCKRSIKVHYFHSHLDCFSETWQTILPRFKNNGRKITRTLGYPYKGGLLLVCSTWLSWGSSLQKSLLNATFVKCLGKWTKIISKFYMYKRVL